MHFSSLCIFFLTIKCLIYTYIRVLCHLSSVLWSHRFFRPFILTSDSLLTTASPMRIFILTVLFNLSELSFPIFPRLTVFYTSNFAHLHVCQYFTIFTFSQLRSPYIWNTVIFQILLHPPALIQMSLQLPSIICFLDNLVSHVISLVYFQPPAFQSFKVTPYLLVIFVGYSHNRMVQVNAWNPVWKEGVVTIRSERKKSWDVREVD